MVANFVLLLLSLLPEAIVPQAEQLDGGLMEQPVSNPEVQNAARFAIQAYNKADNSLFYNREVKLMRAQTQVVEGIMYVLTMEVATTECQKSLPSNDLEQCQIPPGAEHLECEFWVWSRPWLSTQELTNFSCKPVAA
ncbi:cystatin-POGU1-like [Paroedura picta]|uniref:cystatin-POGU1-like n=1 Tax=Paroedura picta TaxID=143630 RepID=UPI0040571633